jgi:biopolymer transport protein ExbD
MNFRHRRSEEPEIALIPFIDVLLVILIFLMLTTTYSKFAELQVNLPVADAEAPREHPREIIVSISADGHYAINRRPIERPAVDVLAAELRAAAGGSQAVVVISADAHASHQSVVNVMDASRRAGLNQLTFATRLSEPARGR